jgi:protein-S-isoprenylcysteine O-methyltransferase Ste14
MIPPLSDLMTSALERALATVRSLLYAAGFVLLWWYVVQAARPLDSRLGFSIPPAARAPGLALVGLGVLLALSCIVAFALVGRGTPAPFDAPREFVAVGPYRWVRNPMYLGAATVIVGAGLAIRSPAALAVAAGFLLLTHLFVVLYEEPTLERRFGESYRAYRRAVNRWLPRPPGPER